MALGKILSKQSKMSEARAVYEKGCQATQGENPYIWQVSFTVNLADFNVISLLVSAFCCKAYFLD